MAARRLTRSSSPTIVSRAPQPTTRASVSNPQKFFGRVGNNIVGPQMWDPRGFWVINDYGAKGRTLHIRPDGTTAVFNASTPGGGGGGAAGGSGAAAGSASPYSLSNLPPDAQYDADVAAAMRTRDTTLANIAGERVRTLSDYGFTEGPNGALAYDPNNPFSKASVLKQSFDTSRRRTSQSMGAAGQLYSGAYQNSQDLLNRNQVQAEFDQGKLLDAFLATNTGQAADARTAYETAVSGAAGDRISRFQTNPLYNPPASQLTPDDVADVRAAVKPGPSKATASIGRPQKTVNGKRYYQRASDGKWIPF